LTEEEMGKAVKQIVFDLGVEKDQAQKWAEEAQDKLMNERESKVTKETVTVVADTEHIEDEQVPAELVSRDQGQTKLPGADLVNGIVNAVKSTYGKAKS
jgi:hypothetical protein